MTRILLLFALPALIASAPVPGAAEDEVVEEVTIEEDAPEGKSLDQEYAGDSFRRGPRPFKKKSFDRKSFDRPERALAPKPPRPDDRRDASPDARRPPAGFELDTDLSEFGKPDGGGPYAPHRKGFEKAGLAARQAVAELQEIHAAWPHAKRFEDIADRWVAQRAKLEKAYARMRDTSLAFKTQLDVHTDQNRRAREKYGFTDSDPAGVYRYWLAEGRSIHEKMALNTQRVELFLAEDTRRLKAFHDAVKKKKASGPILLFLLAAAFAAGIGVALWISRRKQVPPAPVPEPMGDLSGPAGTPLERSPTPGTVSGRASLRPGSMLAENYEIVKEIGRGGMGVVYEAMDTTLQRRVAIKRMREEMLQSKRDLEMFLSEARLVAALRHPNVVEIYSVVKQAEEIFLIFEYVEGWSLAKVLDEREKLKYPQARSVSHQIALALDAAHGKKVIHRDLKPSNVIVTAAGVAKVMDFGIAYQAKKTVARLTRATTWGTPPYMAPEQELGSVSRESDIYALGICLYEMLTGRLPFEGPNFLAQKTNMKFEPPTTTTPGLPPHVDAVIRKALDSEPKNRFHSGVEFAKALGDRH